MADLVFNHSEHHKLISTMQQSLKHSADAMALAFFSPYRPWLLSKDLDFFELASRSGFKVVKVSEVVMDDVMFENDPGVRARFLVPWRFCALMMIYRMLCSVGLSSDTR